MKLMTLQFSFVPFSIWFEDRKIYKIFTSRLWYEDKRIRQAKNIHISQKSREEKRKEKKNWNSTRYFDLVYVLVYDWMKYVILASFSSCYVGHNELIFDYKNKKKNFSALQNQQQNILTHRTHTLDWIEWMAVGEEII